MTKTVAYILGVVTVIAGLWGLAMGSVLGLFDASASLSVVWLVTGVILFAVAMWWADSLSMALIVLGVIYAIVAVLGFVMPGDVLGFLTNTTANDWLHAVLAVVMLVAGYMGRSQSSMQAPMGTM